MASIYWVGSSGDWNDGSNWADGVIPSTQDTAMFTSGTSSTIFGSAYIGTVDTNGASVDFSGDFASDGQNPAEITDGSGTQGTTATMSIDPWAAVSLNTIYLSTTYLDVQGLLTDNAGMVNDVTVQGASGYWLTGGTEIIGTLSIADGGTVAGNVTLSNGSTVICDAASIMENGTLSVIGSGALDFIPAEDGNQPSQQIVTEAFSLASGAVLQMNESPLVDITLDNAISGPGSLELSGSSVVIGSLCTLDGNVSLANGSLTAEGVKVIGESNLAMDGSVLDLRNETIDGQSLLDIQCGGASNTIYGGAGNIDITSDNSPSLTFLGHGGGVTIAAGPAALAVIGGSGTNLIYCGTSGNDSVDVGTGTSTVYATSGSDIVVQGAGTSTVMASTGNETINGATSAGNNYYTGGTGDGVTFIYGGSGNDTISGSTGAIDVVAGNGKEHIWGGSSGHDTITGGLGPDTLFGGTGSTVIAKGSAPNLLGTYSSVDGALLDASASSGDDQLYGGGGSGVITMLGGSGTDLIVGGSSTDSIRCGSGSTKVFAGTGFGDTIVGGVGSDVIVGGVGAHISLNGSSSDIAVSLGQGTLVDAAQSSGSDTIFACGSAITSILGGAGKEVIVGSTSRMSVSAGSGSCEVWGGQSGFDTIFGGDGNDTLVGSNQSTVMSAGAGSNVLVASGTGTSLDTSRSTGQNLLFFSPQGETFVQAGSGSNVMIGNNGSAQLNINAGNDTLWAGPGSLEVMIDSSPLSGNLTIYDFITGSDQIVLSNSGYQDSVENGNTIIIAGSETILLYGFTDLTPGDLVVKQ